MPVITYEGEALSKEQKTKLIYNLTMTASESTGVPAPFFTVVLHEQPAENLGFGGETVEEMKKMLKKKKSDSGCGGKKQ